MKNLRWVTTTFLLSLILAASPSSADDSSSDGNSGWSGGPGGFGDRAKQGRHGEPGGGGPGGGGLLGRDGMKVCATNAGVTFTEGEKPTITDDQKTQIKSCMDSLETSMKTCLTAAGVTMPDPPKKGEKPSGPPPKMDDATKTAIDTCRTQVLGSTSSATATATDTSTDSSTSTSTDSGTVNDSATVRSAL